MLVFAKRNKVQSDVENEVPLPKVNKVNKVN